MATLEGLDDDALLTLSRQTDAVGVVSIYVNADPGKSPNLEGVAIDVRNRVRELERRVADEGPPERARAVSAGLERLAPDVEQLTAAGEPGRGRIAFAALGDDWLVRFAGALPVDNRVVLDDGPFVHPLIEVLDEGRPAGVVLASTDGARLLEWRLGELRELSRMEPTVAEAPHERAGQLGGGPAGRFDSPVREQRKARERDRTGRFLDDVTSAVGRLSAERRWERLLVSGGERWTEPIAAGLPEPLRAEVLTDARVLGGLDDATLAAAVTERLHAAHADHEERLLAQVRDAGLSGAGALGLSEVAAALNVGRAAHLVYDPEVRYAGSVGADGLLYAGEEAGASPATPEPRLTERLLERALETGARVSPVEGGAAGVLRDAQGIAALLRW